MPSEKRLLFERPLSEGCEFLNSSRFCRMTLASIFIGATGCPIVVIKTTFIPTVFAIPLFQGLKAFGISVSKKNGPSFFKPEITFEETLINMAPQVFIRPL